MSAGWAVMLCLLPGAAALQEQAAAALAPKTGLHTLSAEPAGLEPNRVGPERGHLARLGLDAGQ